MCDRNPFQSNCNTHLGTSGDISQEHGDNVTDHEDVTDTADGKASPQIVNNEGIFYSSIRTMSELNRG